MNRIATSVFTLALLAGTAFAQDATDDLFSGTSIFEKNATSVTEINQGPDQLGMVGGSHSPKAHSMLLNVVKSYEYDQPGQYNMADVDKFRQRLNSGDWHCSVHERNLKTGESSDICAKTRTDGYHEQAIISVEKKELTFIHQITKAFDGGHSDATLGSLSGFNGELAPLMAMNSAKITANLATLQAKLSAGLAESGGTVVMVPDGSAGGPPKTFFLEKDGMHVDDATKDGKNFEIKVRKFAGAPSNMIIMTPEDGKAPPAPGEMATPMVVPDPEVPPVPSPAPAPALPVQ